MTDADRARFLRLAALAVALLGIGGLVVGIVAEPWLLGFATGAVGGAAALQGVGQISYPGALATTDAGRRRRRYGGAVLLMVGVAFLAVGVWYGLT